MPTGVAHNTNCNSLTHDQMPKWYTDPVLVLHYRLLISVLSLFDGSEGAAVSTHLWNFNMHVMTILSKNKTKKTVD